MTQLARAPLVSLITLVYAGAVAHVNEINAQGLKWVCPNQVATYVDKGYCTKPEKQAAARE